MTAAPSTTLTDRYVWAVLRSVPSKQRDELEREVRALVADAVEAKTAADPTLDAAAAERAALEELGDPGALATGYTGEQHYVIGPGVYPVWRGLLTLLLGLVVPIVGVAVLAANLIAGTTVGQAIVTGGITAFQAAVQMCFWVTLVFALVERFGGPDERAELQHASVALSGGAAHGGAWSLDDLPELPDDGRMSLFDMAAAVALNVVVLAFLFWVQLAGPIVVDGESLPLFDPALWSFWLPWFIVITVIEILFTIAVYVRGRWTYLYAVGNALLGAAFAIPAIYLLANDLLFNPDRSAPARRPQSRFRRYAVCRVMPVRLTWPAADADQRRRGQYAHARYHGRLFRSPPPR
jgi:hypothetical protein